MRLKQREEKPTAVLTQNQDLPPLNLAVPTSFYFVSKLGAQTPLFRKGGDFQSPVRHSAPHLTLDIAMDACSDSHRFTGAKTRQSQLLMQQKPQKDGSPHCQSHPCPDRSTHTGGSRRPHTDVAAGVFPTAAKSSLKARCLAEPLFPQINTHSLTQNRESPYFQKPSLDFRPPPSTGGMPLGRTVPWEGTDGQRTPRGTRAPRHTEERRFSHHPLCSELPGRASQKSPVSEALKR